ncbi:MAG: uracil-DNA glycosylase [Planctomycetaceae bacterium]|nr:uracil-DNA glycosylase [Planctomycetaceae bacterium]MBP60137.1 uracil-DNA glycosylase [Planctomycetaceae bacterium]
MQIARNQFRNTVLDLTTPTESADMASPSKDTDPAVAEASHKTLQEDSIAREARSQQQRLQELKVIQQEVANCDRCAELAATRTQTVFGVGNPAARLCFFGEAPGADEDRQGEPFVGRAGRLLDDIITKGMGLSREDVYILNVLKCRPPGNRNPSPEEAENCFQFFERQLEAIQPEFLCCLGAVAAANLLQTTETIGRLRGRFHNYRGIRVIATYHPAYLLRNPPAKKEVWKDIQLLMKEMEISIKGAKLNSGKPVHNPAQH